MTNPASYKNSITSITILVACIIYSATSFAGGGGGGGGLDTQKGLERAADNFLIAFALLTKTEDVKLAPINGVEGNLEFQWKTRILDYKYGSSLWHINILSTNYFIDMPRSQDISSEEYQNFRNDYILQRTLKREKAARNNSLKNTAKTPESSSL